MNKIHILENILQQEQHEVICLTETWINDAQRHLIQVNGYEIAASFCRRERRGGGVATLIRNGLEYNIRQDIIDLSVEYIVECCAIEIKPNILVINIYRADRDIEIFFNFLNKLCAKIMPHCYKKHVIISGDFNLCAIKNTNNYKRLLHEMLQCRLYQVVHKPTRETHNSTSCIDLVFSNNKNYNLDVEDLGISDHKSVIYSFKIPTQAECKKMYTSKRIFNEKNIMSFKRELNKTDWHDFISPNNNINTNYNSFNDKLNHILDSTIPITRIKLIRKNKQTWLSKGLKISCYHKRLLKILSNKSNNKILKTHFRTYSKTLKKATKTAKKLAYSKEMNSSKNKTKTMWKITNKITSKTKHKQHQNIKIKTNNHTIECPKTIANTFNNFFVSVGSSTLPHQNTLNLPTNCKVKTPAINSMFLEPVTEREVYRMIRNLPNKSSCGIDDIPLTLIKACIEELTPPLTYLINQSFKESTFPEVLKIAKIKPILKKGGCSEIPDQYRPIALLPVLSKFFEKAMTNRIYNFLEKYNLINQNQYGFRKKRSTTQAVYTYVQEILTYIRDKSYAVGILLDMSKAYDRVSHVILLSKLYEMGIRGAPHKWIKSYLADRRQCVQIDHLDKDTGELKSVLSDMVVTNCSIPQGSVIGCILFLIYINDLPNVANPLCVLFADDVSLLFQCKKIENDTINQMTNTYETAKRWLQDHNLEINNKKTKIIQFRPYQKQQLDLQVISNSLNIQETDNFTLLGITLDSHLNWKSHVEKIKTKLSQFTYALSVIKINTNRDCALSAYYAYAYAWLRYGVVLWGHSTDTNDLFVIQKKCLRIINNIRPRESCKPHFLKGKILTLPSIYILESAIFVRQNINLFEYVKSDRRKANLTLPTPRIEMFRNSPLYRCILLYNKLPDYIKNEENVTTFKNKLKYILLNKCYYNVEEFMNDNF